MSSHKLIRILIVPGLLAVMPVACVYDPVYYGPRHGTVHPVQEPWGYYYYPDVQVYFHYSSGFYFYFDNGLWLRTRILPRHYILNPRARVHLHIKNHKPYIFHREHRQKYRPDYPHRSDGRQHNDRNERDHKREQMSPRHDSRPVLPPRREIERDRRSERKHETERPPRQDKDPGPIYFDSAPQHQPVPLAPEQEKSPRQPQDKKSHDNKVQKRHEKQHESNQDRDERRSDRHRRGDDDDNRRWR